MEFKIILAFAALIYQAQSQLCVSPGAAPQVIATPVVTTTIVDNSVANALANAIQLLIVSDIIESKLGAACVSNALFDSVNPLYTSIVDVISPYAPCSTPVEYISPYGPIIEAFTPNCCGGIAETIYSNPYRCAEIISPNLCGYSEIIGPNFVSLNPYGLTEVISASCVPNIYGVSDIIGPAYGPNCYGGVTEFITPNPFNPGCGVAEFITATTCAPNYYGGLTEVITPISPYNTGCYGGINELLAPIPYNTYTEVISPFNCGCGVTEIISPIPPCNSGCFGGGISEIISPISPFNPGCGLTEVIPPCIGPIPYNPGCFSGVPEVIVNPYGPYCGGIPEIILPYPPLCPGEIISPGCSLAPVAAEVLFPPAIPAQLRCNFGYMPSNTPCVGVNVETLPFETCGTSFYF